MFVSYFSGIGEFVDGMIHQDNHQLANTALQQCERLPKMCFWYFICSRWIRSFFELPCKALKLYSLVKKKGLLITNISLYVTCIKGRKCHK